MIAKMEVLGLRILVHTILVNSLLSQSAQSMPQNNTDQITIDKKNGTPAVNSTFTTNISAEINYSNDSHASTADDDSGDNVTSWNIDYSEADMNTGTTANKCPDDKFLSKDKITGQYFCKERKKCIPGETPSNPHPPFNQDYNCIPCEHGTAKPDYGNSSCVIWVNASCSPGLYKVREESAKQDGYCAPCRKGQYQFTIGICYDCGSCECKTSGGYPVMREADCVAQKQDLGDNVCFNDPYYCLDQSPLVPAIQINTPRPSPFLPGSNYGFTVGLPIAISAVIVLLVLLIVYFVKKMQSQPRITTQCIPENDPLTDNEERQPEMDPVNPNDISIIIDNNPTRTNLTSEDSASDRCSDSDVLGMF